MNHRGNVPELKLTEASARHRRDDRERGSAGAGAEVSVFKCFTLGGHRKRIRMKKNMAELRAGL